MALDSLISLVELTNEESNRMVDLYPEAKINTTENTDQEQQSSWWNNVSLNYPLGEEKHDFLSWKIIVLPSISEINHKQNYNH